MANELKTTVINMKTLSQNIADPVVVVGAGDAAGNALRVIFTQEAAARFTKETKVYLSWWHQEQNIKGYNVFTEIIKENDKNFPPTWEIKYPKSMLYEGNALACIQIVDKISIATSVNFMIHIFIDPNDGSDFEPTNDFTEFQRAITQLASIEEQMRTQMNSQKDEFDDMLLSFSEIQTIASESYNIATEANQKCDDLLASFQFIDYSEGG